MKSQIYAVPPTPVQEYQEALILLWMIFLTETWTLKGYIYISIHYNHSVEALDSTFRQVSLWMSGTLRQLPLKTLLRSRTLWQISLWMFPWQLPLVIFLQSRTLRQVSLHPYLSHHRGGLWENREWAGMILKSLQARGEGVSWSAYESSRWRLWWGLGGRSQHGCSIRWSRRRRSW